MIVVVNLITSVFYYLFIAMLTIELIFLVISVIGYNSSLASNMKDINRFTEYNQGNMTLTFSNLLISEFANVRSDLLLIAKHINPLYLSLVQQTNSSNYFKFNQDSPLMQNLRSYNPFITYSPSNDYKGADTIYKTKWNHYALQDLSFPNDENKIMDKFLNDDIFNKIFAYSTEDLSRNNTEVEKLKVYVNYLIPVLKSIMVRSAIYEKNNNIYTKFHLFLNDKYVLEYPPNISSKTDSKNKLNFYSDRRNCNETNYIRCVSPIYTLNEDKVKTINKNKIAFDDMKFSINGELISRGCIRINYLENSMNSYVCIEFNFDNILRQDDKTISVTSANNINKYSMMFLYGLDRNKNENKLLDLYYSSKYNITQIQYKIKSGSIDLIEGLIESLDVNQKENRVDYDANYETFQKLFSGDFIEIYNNKSIYNIKDLGYFSKDDFVFYKDIENKIKKDKIKLMIKPIFLSGLEYDNEKFIFTEEGKTQSFENPICYVMIAMLYGNEMLKYTINSVLILKSVRLWLFAIFLILLSTIIFYIVIEIFLKYFLNSLKIIKERLKIIIKSKKTFGNENSVVANNNYDFSNQINGNKIEQSLFRDVDIIAKNKETKDLFKTLEFLNKILLMKNAHDQRNYQETSDVFKKFENQFNSLEKHNTEGFRNFKLKIIYNCYKQGLFTEAYSNLDIFLKSVKDEISNSHLENNILDIKTTNLEAYPYINDFSDFSSMYDKDKEKKKITLKISLSIGYFYYGFLKFKEGEEKLNAIKKSEEFQNNDSEKKYRKKAVGEPYFNDAIYYLNESIKICRSENMNKIKTIIMIVYVAKCHYHKQEYNEASIKIRDAMVEFGNFNMNFFDAEKVENKILPKIDPKIMVIVNSNIMEQILFNLSKITKKLLKKRLSGWIMNKMLDNAYYMNHQLFSKVIQRLKKMLFSNEDMDLPLDVLIKKPKYKKMDVMEYYIYKKSKALIERIISRIDITKAASKYITFLTTENLLRDFPCPIDLKSFLMRTIQKYLKESDIMSFIQCNELGNIHLEKTTVRNIEEFKSRADLFEIHDFKKMENKKHSIVDFSGGLWTVIEEIKHLEASNHTNLDKIVFCFMNSDDFRLRSEEDDIFEELINENVAVYCFIFDDVEEKKLNRIKDFVKNLDEGHVILVRNYEIVERAFQNISYSIENKNNVINIKFSNHNYIV